MCECALMHIYLVILCMVHYGVRTGSIYGSDVYASVQVLEVGKGIVMKHVVKFFM